MVDSLSGDADNNCVLQQPVHGHCVANPVYGACRRRRDCVQVVHNCVATMTRRPCLRYLSINWVPKYKFAGARAANPWPDGKVCPDTTVRCTTYTVIKWLVQIRSRTWIAPWVNKQRCSCGGRWVINSSFWARLREIDLIVLSGKTRRHSEG